MKSELGTIFEHSNNSLAVTFLVLNGASIMCVASALDPLRAANRVTGRNVFSWQIVSTDGQPSQTTCGVRLPVDGKFDPLSVGDVLIVIAGFGTREQFTPQLKSSFARAARQVRAVGGVEAGSWLLAKTGLLDGRRATTHWEDLEDFAAAFPEIQVLPDRYIVDGRCFTSGGASPTFDLMLHLVRARLGVAAALDVASVFIHGEGRAADEAQPLVSLGRPDSYDPRISKAIRLMEERIDRPLTISAIARRLNLSVRGLEKLFRSSIGETPGAYYLRLRLSLARRMVTDTSTPLADIADRTGFSSVSAFSRAFTANFETPPSALRRAQARSSATAMP